MGTLCGDSTPQMVNGVSNCRNPFSALCPQLGQGRTKPVDQHPEAVLFTYELLQSQLGDWLWQHWPGS